MRKLFQFFVKTFVSQIFVWKFYTVKEFFEQGGYIYTLMPDCKDGSNLGNYCKYLSYEAFVKDWPDNYWLVGEHTEYVISGQRAKSDSVPETGFVCRIPHNIPNYMNVSLAMIAIGILIVICSLFCLSAIAGFSFVGTIVACLGILMYHQSARNVIVKK